MCTWVGYAGKIAGAHSERRTKSDSSPPGGEWQKRQSKLYERSIAAIGPSPKLRLNSIFGDLFEPFQGLLARLRSTAFQAPRSRLPRGRVFRRSRHQTQPKHAKRRNFSTTRNRVDGRACRCYLCAPQTPGRAATCFVLVENVCRSTGEPMISMSVIPAITNIHTWFIALSSVWS